MNLFALLPRLAVGENRSASKDGFVWWHSFKKPVVAACCVLKSRDGFGVLRTLSKNYHSLYLKSWTFDILSLVCNICRSFWAGFKVVLRISKIFLKNISDCQSFRVFAILAIKRFSNQSKLTFVLPISLKKNHFVS